MANRLTERNRKNPRNIDFSEASGEGSHDWSVRASPWPWADPHAFKKADLMHAMPWAATDERLRIGEGTTSDLLTHIGKMPIVALQNLDELPGAVWNAFTLPSRAMQGEFEPGPMLPDETTEEYSARAAALKEREIRESTNFAMMVSGAGGEAAPVTTNRLVVAGKAFGREPAEILPSSVLPKGPAPPLMTAAEYGDFVARSGGKKELTGLAVLGGEKRGGLYSALAKEVEKLPGVPEEGLTAAEWIDRIHTPGREEVKVLRDEKGKVAIDPETGKPRTKAYKVEASSPLPGVKPDEYLPLVDRLKEIRDTPGSNQGPISKDDILEMVREGMPKINVITHDLPELTVHADDDGYYRIVTADGEPYEAEEFMTREKAEAALDDLKSGKGKNPLVYDQYVLPNGRRQREHLYQTPLSGRAAGRWHILDSEGYIADDRTFASRAEAAAEMRGLGTAAEMAGGFGGEYSLAQEGAAAGSKPSYVSPHWDAPGEEDVAFHTRTNDRKVAVDGYVVENKSGNKSQLFSTMEEAQAYQKDLPGDVRANTIIVKGRGPVDALHVEEMQADLHQSGRKYGYDTPEEHAKLDAKEEEALQEKGKRQDELNAKLDEAIKFVNDNGLRPASVGKVHRANVGYSLTSARNFAVEMGLTKDVLDRAQALHEGIAKARNAVTAAEKPLEEIKLRRTDLTPDAPFKKTEQWTGIILKHMVQDAVARGKKFITWTTGQIQKDRFALTNHISELRYEPVGEGEYLLRARTANGGRNITLNNGNPVAAHELSQLVGEEVAAKIIKDEGRVPDTMLGSTKQKVLDGLDLSVGGKGMEGYYNDMVPKIAKAIFKKYGVKEIEKAEPVGVRPTVDMAARDAALQKHTQRMTEIKTQYDAEVDRIRKSIPEDEPKSWDSPARQAARDAGEAAWTKRVEDESVAQVEYRRGLAAAMKPVELHMMRITPELEEAAANEGFTLYAGRNRAAMFGLLKPTQEGNKLGFHPDLRVRVPNPRGLPDKPLITQTTTNRNAPAQLDNVDLILAGHPQATDSPMRWSRMMSQAFASDEVPAPPYAFIRDINGAAAGAAAKIRLLTPGQIADADGGFDFSREMRDAYINGELSPTDTGKLFMWSFLSRGVSPYTQESLFIDAFEGADHWIQKAADGDFTKADIPAYKEWAATTSPKGSGQPGSGSMHNLNAFGSTFLLKMGRLGADGISNLQRLHNMLSDPNMTGALIRREFMKFGEGVGIDNKVVSFTMLVAGHHDVMVIDRVQTRQLWDDGRFADRNIYDGEKVNKKVVTGTALANLTYGARGLLVYEAIERGLGEKIHDIYAAAGRPQDASIGRYHWESWVAYSQQEASHGSLGAVLGAVKARQSGSNVPAISAVSAKEGEYGGFAYGARYARDENGSPFFSYTTPVGNTYEFSVPAWRQFLADVKKRKAKVVPKGFKVTESGNAPWFEQSGVNREALDRLAANRADRPGSGALRAPGQNSVARGPAGSGGDWRNDPILHHSGATLTPVDHDPFTGEPK